MSLGITVVLIIILLCIFSWWSKTRSNYTVALIFLVLAGAILRIYLASDNFLHPWDERYHALVAKNLLQHPFLPTLFENPVLPFDYKSWVGSHVWLHKQPMTLWSIMLSYKIFGVHVFATRIPSIIFSTIGIVLTYSIGRRLFSKDVGYIAAFLFAINGLIIEMSSGRVTTDHVDILFMFFVLLGVYFAVRFSENVNVVWNILCGLAIGAAILTKWLPALIVLPVWLSLVYSKEVSFKKIVLHGFLLVTVIICVVSPWQIYIWSEFPLEAKWEYEFNMRHLSEALEGHSKNYLFHFDVLRISYGEIVYLPIGWFIYVTLKSKFTDLKKWGLLFWALVPFIFFSFAATKMQGYTLFSASAIFLITAIFYLHLQEASMKSKYKYLFQLCCILLLALPIRYSFERVKPFQVIERDKDWNVDLRSFCKSTPSLDEKTIVYNVDHPIELMFYCDVTAYPQILSDDLIESLKLKGYTLIDYNKKL